MHQRFGQGRGVGTSCPGLYQNRFLLQVLLLSWRHANISPRKERAHVTLYTPCDAPSAFRLTLNLHPLDAHGTTMSIDHQELVAAEEGGLPVSTPAYNAALKSFAIGKALQPGLDFFRAMQQVCVCLVCLVCRCYT